MYRTQTTLGDLVRVVQDVAGSDAEVIAVMAHIFASRRVTYLPRPSHPPGSKAA